MKINRRTRRLGAAIILGAGLGLAAPNVPVFGQTSPGSQCQQALLGAQSQVLATQSRLRSLGNQSIPVGVQSQLVGVQSQLAALSQVCANLPGRPAGP